MKLTDINAFRKFQKPQVGKIGEDEFYYLPMSLAESKRLASMYDADSIDYGVVAEVVHKLIVTLAGDQVFKNATEFEENLSLDLAMEIVEQLFGKEDAAEKKPVAVKRKKTAKRKKRK